MPDALKTPNQYRILYTKRTACTTSRTEIDQISGHSQATVTNITAKMIPRGMIYEKEIDDSSARGRTRVMLAINPDAAYVVVGK